MTSQPIAESALQVRDGLVRLNAHQLEAVYAAGESIPIPGGRSRGIALLFPNSGLTPLLAQISRLVWQGKVVDPARGTLVNRVVGFPLIPAKVYEGESWFDDGRAIIIDYAETSSSFFYMRDEVRRIADGLWLGRSYYRKGPRGKYVLTFAMDFTALARR
jgi:hypothetical protein